MKKVLLSIFMFSVLSTANAQVKMPALSPTQTLKQEFGIGSIEIKYSRPAIRSRKIFGKVVPYGTLWRTGANAATQIRFTEPVMVNGMPLDSGSYVLYTIPNPSEWEIIFNKGLNNWGIDGYKKEEDVLRFAVPVTKMKSSIESLTLQLAAVAPQNCELHLMWDKTAVIVPITTDIKPKLKVQLEDALKGEKKPYWQAAQFYNEYENDSQKALDYADKAIEQNKEAYWIWIYKARIQLKLGDKSGALISSQQSKQLAEKAGNDDYVRMNEEFQKTLK
jgi:hypothetical protein